MPAAASTSPAWWCTRVGWPLDDKTGGGSFHVSLGRAAGVGRLSSSTSITRTRTSRRSTNSSATSIHPGSAPASRRRQAPRLWRARDHRGRAAIGAEAGVSRRRADRLLGRLRQRAAHQGQPQRDEVRHASRRKRRSRPSQPAASAMCLTITTDAVPAEPDLQGSANGCATPSRCLSRFGTFWGGVLGMVDMWTTTLLGGLSRSSARSSTARATPPPPSRQEAQADRLSQARRRAHFRQVLFGVSVEHQSRGGSAGSPQL